MLCVCVCMSVCVWISYVWIAWMGFSGAQGACTVWLYVLCVCKYTWVYVEFEQEICAFAHHVHISTDAGAQYMNLSTLSHWHRIKLSLIRSALPRVSWHAYVVCWSEVLSQDKMCQAERELKQWYKQENKESIKQKIKQKINFKAKDSQGSELCQTFSP